MSRLRVAWQKLLFLILVFSFAGTVAAKDVGNNCGILFIRWANAETMNDFWRGIKSDKTLGEVPSRKFLTWVMTSALRIDREKVIAEWQRTVQEEFSHTWRFRSMEEDYHFYRLMGEIIYALESAVATDFKDLVHQLQQAHAKGMLLGVRNAFFETVAQREEMLNLHQASMSDQSCLAILRGGTVIQASFDQNIREIFQAYSSLIPSRILEPAQVQDIIDEIQNKVATLPLKWEIEEMIFQVLRSKLRDVAPPKL